MLRFIKDHIFEFLMIMVVAFLFTFTTLAWSWDHTVIMKPKAGSSYNVPLVEGQTSCIYVTDCVTALIPATAISDCDSPDPVETPPVDAPKAISELPVPRGAYGWTFGVLMDRSNWTVTADMSESLPEYQPGVVIDDDPNTKWHTPFKSGNTDKDKPHPHWLIIDLGEKHWVDGLVYTPRVYTTDLGINYKNGILKDYEVWVGNDLNAWGQVASGTLVYDDIPQIQVIDFLIPNQARYVKVVFLSDINASPYATAAEINITESLRDYTINAGGVN
jgi:hypothetical protein